MSVTFVASSKLPTRWGTFTMHGFLEQDTGKEHVVLTMGDVADGQPVLGRLHSECLTGDALFSLRCDCGFQLEAALQAIAEEGRGALLYLRQEGMRLTLNEQGLTTLTLLIAESDPKAKDLMARLVMNLIADDVGDANGDEASTG